MTVWHPIWQHFRLPLKNMKQSKIVYGTARIHLADGWYVIDELVRDLQKIKESQAKALDQSMKPTTPNRVQSRAPEAQE